MRYIAVLCIVFVFEFRAIAGAEVRDIAGGPIEESRVPAWDARGLGPLPWQGIACVDVSANGRFVAVGTIAPHGDPNVFLLDSQGKLVRQHPVGMRFINDVAAGADDTALWAFSTTSTGQAADRPTVFAFTEDGKKESAPGLRMFHYGDHSNHLPPVVRSAGRYVTVADSRGLRWHNTATDKTGFNHYGKSGGSIVTYAVSASGRAVVGRSASDEDSAQQVSLALLAFGERMPLWERPPITDLWPAPKLERGRYGPSAPEHEDKPIYAPLAVAISVGGSRLAAADIQGWSRTFVGRGGQHERFVPARPVISVYDDQGAELQQFGPETVQQPGWWNLAFTHDGSRLLVYPHSWTCRGLAGLAVLPTDDNARYVHVLSVENGDVLILAFPDTVADVASLTCGRTAVACWDGKVYLLGPAFTVQKTLPIGGPCLLDASADGSRLLLARTDGVVRMVDVEGQTIWETHLNEAATRGDKPWTKNQKASELATGVWRTNGGLAHSDMGGQYLIEAPDGCVLIDPNAAHSIEQNRAKIAATGRDPMEVRYVIPTHEHGDHAPGAYLWRVVSGAEVIATPEVAYSLQHHVPAFSGYGFHPPTPTDIIVEEGDKLELAGRPFRFTRLPGHTGGSLGTIFEIDGETAITTGDVIMPDGTLGYAGSINFSPHDVLSSMRKLQKLAPAYIFAGHGGGEPEVFWHRGIEVGEATGWGKMMPPKPDPLYGFETKNYLVVAWQQPAAGAAYGDIDGDGLADVALAASACFWPERFRGAGSIKVFLNRGGRFESEPDFVYPLSTGVSLNGKLRMGHLNDDGVADLFAGTSEGVVVLESQRGELDYRALTIPPHSIMQMIPADTDGDGIKDLVIAGRFGSGTYIVPREADGTFARPQRLRLSGTPFDAQVIDLNGDDSTDLIFSSGDVFFADADGKWPDQPSVQLPTHDGWTFTAAADFNADSRPDVALASNNRNTGVSRLTVFRNTGDASKPFATEPTRTITLPDAWVLRDGPTIADYNGDGIADLILCGPNSRHGAVVVPGSKKGLDPDAVIRITFHYTAHYDTKIGAADFNGDGKPDLASFGPSDVGAPGVYIWLQP